jgi:hypothetical protein
MYQQLYFILQHFIFWFCLLIFFYFVINHFPTSRNNKIENLTTKQTKYAKKYSPDDFFFICINEWEDKKNKAILQKNIIIDFLKKEKPPLQKITLLDITQNNNCFLKEFANSISVAKIIHQLISPNDKPIYLQQNIETTMNATKNNILTCLDYQYYLTEPKHFQNILNKNDDADDEDTNILCLQLLEEGICSKPLQKKTKNEFVDYVAKKNISIKNKKLSYSFFPKLSTIKSATKREYEFTIYNCNETMEKTIDKMKKMDWILKDEIILPYEDDVGRSFLCFFEKNKKQE